MSLAETYARTETSSVPAPDLIDVSTRAGKKQARAERRLAKRERRTQKSAASPIPTPAINAATIEQLPTQYAHGQWHWIPAHDAPAGDGMTDAAMSGDSTTPDSTARTLPEMRHQAITTPPISPAPSPAEPVRAPAQVMRIVVTAWEDDTGSLHMPSTIFTEIEPRRWKVGSPAIQTSAGFRLFEGLGNQATTPDTAQRPSL